jgi:hypothetical protein
MEIYERPGWGHPSPIINPGQPIIEEVLEDAPEEEFTEENQEE